MDIFNLLKSKTRKKLLQFFFKNKEKKYYLRELERTLDLPVGNIRREFTSLDKTRLFNREKMGNQVYYSLNKNSPYFEGVEHIVSKTANISSNKAMGMEVRKRVSVGQEDLNSLISKINELENTLENISRNMPRRGFTYQLRMKKRKGRKEVSY